jgi:hypothetical protein
MRTFIVVALLLMLGLNGAAQVSETPAPAAPRPEPAVNVDRLPLDLERLERRLRQSSEQENWDGFRLRYRVDVFGTAPRIQFFAPEDVLPSGPIPYGAPTHQEMLEVMTPKEFRAPVMDFSALMRWLEGKLK